MQLAAQIERYLEELARAGASPHTRRGLRGRPARSFWSSFRRPKPAPPAPAAIDLLILREWLAWLYDQDLDAVTIRRKLAAVRGLFRFLLREGVVRVNVARLVRTPKAPKKLPEVMTPEQANTLDRRRGRGQAGAAASRRATAPSSSCSTAAACASASWPG